MHAPTKITNSCLGLLACFFVGMHIYLADQSLRSMSATYDEPVHLTAGYVYMKTGDYRMNGLHHPPLAEMWAAVPLLFQKLFIPKQHPAWIKQQWGPTDQYQFADSFLFKNRRNGDEILHSARRMQVLLSLLLGLVIFLAGRYFSGYAAAFYSLGLWAFCPMFLTHGTIVSTDLAFTIFFFSFFSFLPLAKNFTRAFFLGFLLGGAASSKFFFVSIGPVLIVLNFWKWIISRGSIKKMIPQENLLKVLLGVGVGFFVTISLMYQFSGFEIFWEGLKNFFSRAEAGRSSFLWGKHGTLGWLMYFPFAFIVHTPIPVLMLFLVAVFESLRKKIQFASTLWIPPLVFFGLCCISNVQIGHRYILAIYPFIIVMIGIWLSQVSWGKLWGGAAVVVMFVEMLFVQPHFLAYFNSFVGGSSQGYRYLTDSNVDWGQGLKMLSQILSSEDLKKGIYLSYFGVVDPHIYGIRYIDIGSDRIVAHQDDSADQSLSPTKFAISVTNLQSTYYSRKDVFDWLKNTTPWAKVGHSIFVYDFENSPEVLENLKQLR